MQPIGKTYTVLLVAIVTVALVLNLADAALTSYAVPDAFNVGVWAVAGGLFTQRVFKGREGQDSESPSDDH